MEEGNVQLVNMGKLMAMETKPRLRFVCGRHIEQMNSRQSIIDCQN